MKRKQKSFQTLYPFKSRFIALEAGSMHYIDEGAGQPVLFLHGNPDWSFSFRKVIKLLKGTHRCIAPDHIGFGLSDKPVDWSYTPWDHAKNLEEFVLSLGLQNLILVVNDWGGPIGFDFLFKHADRVKRVVIMNTWMWPLNDYPAFWLFGRLMSGKTGKLLTGQFNLFATLLLWLAIYDKQQFTQEIHKHYCAPHDKPQKRIGSIVFPRYLMDASDWFQGLWDKRAILQQMDCRLVWGMRDLAFGNHFLEKWKSVLPGAPVWQLGKTGHFPQEEAANQVCHAITNQPKSF